MLTKREYMKRDLQITPVNEVFRLSKHCVDCSYVFYPRKVAKRDLDVHTDFFDKQALRESPNDIAICISWEMDEQVTKVHGPAEVVGKLWLNVLANDAAARVCKLYGLKKLSKEYFSFTDD